MNVVTTLYFSKQFKKIVPKKISLIAWNNLLGFLSQYEVEKNDNIGEGFLKVRYEESKMLRGKNLRIICFALIRYDRLFPLTIYAKQSKSTLSQKEIRYHFRQVQAELLNTPFSFV